MWKKIAGGLLATIVALAGLTFYLSDKIYLRESHEPPPPSELDRPLSAEEVREDVAHLVAMFERIHPAFEDIGGAAYREATAALASDLEGPIDRMALYRRLAPLNRLLLDGHTKLRNPIDYRRRYESDGGLYPAMTVRHAGDALVVDRPLVEGGELQPGDRLVSINGLAGEDLARFSLDLQSGEGPALREAYSERSFYLNAWAAGLEAPFRVELEREGQTRVVEVQGLTRPEYVEGRDSGGGGRNSFEILDDGTGLLVFNDMPSGRAEFRSFLASTFETIHERGIERLILDIRGNGGGDSRAGDRLLSYLTDRELPAIERVEVKVTDEIKAYYETLLPRGFRWLPIHRLEPMLAQIREAESGQSFTMHPPPTEARPRAERPEHAFDGELIVLTGPKTYSSAVIFAAPLKHYGRATFVGEETGEPLIFFGENYYFDLPNSRLQGVVSHKKFVLVGAVDHRTGIIPDVAAPYRDALRTATARR